MGYGGCMKENNVLSWLGLEKQNYAQKLKDDGLQLLVHQVNNALKLINLIEDELSFATDEQTSTKTTRRVVKVYRDMNKYRKALTTSAEPYIQEFNARQLEEFSCSNNSDDKKTYVGTERTDSEFVRQHRHSVVKLRELIQSLLFKFPQKDLTNAAYNLNNSLLEYLRTPISNFSQNFEGNLAIKYYDINNCDQITLDI